MKKIKSWISSLSIEFRIATMITFIAVMVMLLFIGAHINNKKETKILTQKEVERVITPEELRAEQEQQELQRLADEEERKLRLLNELKLRLETEIKLLDEPFDISGYCYSVESMNGLVTLLHTRAKIIRESKPSDNAEIKQLTEKLRVKAVAYQIKAFPILRKAYTTGLNKELWAVDGKAYVSGKGNIYITVVSPELVQNRMKQAAHFEILSTLVNLRFRQARYKYYDGSAYTYWTVFEGKDADLIEKKILTHKQVMESAAMQGYY